MLDTTLGIKQPQDPCITMIGITVHVMSKHYKEGRPHLNSFVHVVLPKYGDDVKKDPSFYVYISLHIALAEIYM